MNDLRFRSNTLRGIISFLGIIRFTSDRIIKLQELLRAARFGLLTCFLPMFREGESMQAFDFVDFFSFYDRQKTQD